MPDFRKWILALAVLALFTGLASAQVGGQTNGTPFTCTTSNASVTPILRSEGLTELVGDIVLACTGGPLPVLGAVVPTANFTVFLNTSVTSRLLGTNGVTGASEALLLVDEPGSNEPGYGPTLPQIICGAPQDGAQNPQQAGVTNGCPQWVGQTSTTPFGFNQLVPVASNPNNGVLVNGVNSYNPAFNLAPGANVFQGIVSGNQVAFFGVPLLAPSTSGQERVFRITNIRANASQISAGGPTPGSVNASISISSSTAVSITTSTLVVGFVQSGLTTSIRNTSNTGTSGGAALAQCTSLANGAGLVILNYAENFPTAFKTQYQNPGAVLPTNQNIPGTLYSSESGFVQRSVTGSSTSTGTAYVAGQADYGTRLKAVFNNIPAGVSIFVSTRDILNGFTAVAGSSTAVLVVNENAPSNGAVPTVTQSGTAGSTSTFIPIAPVTITNGSGTATWEVLTTNNSALDTLSFGVFASFTANAANNVPVPGSWSVTMSYAPTPSGGQFTAASGGVASATLTIPRFVDSGTGRTIATVSLCTTALLFPYVTNINGFDTGMVLANTTTDPFGTAAQNGTCTLNFYSAPTATATFTTPNIVSGSVYANLASVMDAGFNGYSIAICNFQLAHGFAFISDVGARNLAMGYLALIITNGNSLNRGNNAGENLNN